MVSYILILKLEKDKIIKVGALGKLNFKKGFYMYVGSAKSSIKRIERHFRTDKKLRWHIDYLSVNADVLNTIVFSAKEVLECHLANILSQHFEGTKNFGCSDCECYSHLFFSEKNPIEKLAKLFENYNFRFYK